MCDILVLTVLKKNYTRLWQCLPQDYMKTINMIRQLRVFNSTDDDSLSKITQLRSLDAINQHIIANMMLMIPTDEVAKEFCNVMEMLVDNNSKKYVETLRNGKWFMWPQEFIPASWFMSIWLVN